jgi:cytochrome c
LLIVGACAPKPTVTPPTAAAATIGELAGPGGTVFSNRCAGCHGNEGQGGFGPPLMGAQATLGRYGNAGALYDFIRQAMPFNAPGSLPQHEYEQVLGYLLVQNGFAQETTPFKSGDLQSLLFTE